METRRIIPQAMLAAITGLGDILAGVILALYFPRDVTWAMILYPPLIGVRGAVAGSLTGRLSSALNVGTVRPRFRDNTERFHEIIISTLMASLVAALIASAVAMSIASAMSLSFDVDMIIAVSLIGVTGTTTLLIPVNLTTSFIAFRKGMDPDVILYPAMSTLADVLVTLMFILSVRGDRTLNLIISAVLSLSILTYFLIHGKGVRDMIEIAMASVLVLLVEGVAGSVLERVREGLSPAVLLIYPAMMTEIGDSASIVGSLITTRILLGSAGRLPLLDVKEEVMGVFTVFLSFFGFMGVVSGLIGGNPIGSLLAFLIAFPITLMFTTGVVIVTRGRADPDNFVIPLSSSVADLVTTGAVALLIQIGLI